MDVFQADHLILRVTYVTLTQLCRFQMVHFESDIPFPGSTPNKTLLG